MSDMNRASEKWLEKTLQSEVEKRGGVTVKLTDAAKRGLPDRLVLWPGGVAEFVEVKSTGKKPDAMQRLIIENLKRIGFRCAVISTETDLTIWLNFNRALIRQA